MKCKHKLLTAAVAALMAASTVDANAATTPYLFIDDGAGNTITIEDGSILDANAAVGAVTYIGAVGTTWFLNVDTGTSKPIIGIPSRPEMDLNFNATSTSAGGTLTISFFDDNFAALSVASGVTTMNIGGTMANANSSVSYSSKVGSGPVATTGTIDALPLAFANQTYGSASDLDSVFGMLQTVVITHGAGSQNQQTTGNAHLAVPEPSTYFAGAMLLLPFAASTVRFIRKNRAA